MKLKEILYYWHYPDKHNTKVFRNAVYFKWENGNWMKITYEEWCEIAKRLKKATKIEQPYQTVEVKLIGMPPLKYLKRAGLA